MNYHSGIFYMKMLPKLFTSTNAALVCLTTCLLLFASCVNTKKAIYFSDQPNAVLPGSNFGSETIIQSNDLLSISVNSRDPEATALFNSFNISGTSYSSSAGNTTQVNGYSVNAEGYIKVPFLGNIKAAGLTESKIADAITQGLLDKKLLLDPVVSVRHLNFKVTVLGEVARPTVVTVPNGKISLKLIGIAMYKKSLNQKILVAAEECVQPYRGHLKVLIN